MKRLLFIAVMAGVLCSQPSAREQVGKLPDGSFLLSSGWRLKPAGVQVPLDTLPMSSVLSRDGKFLLVLNGGYNPPSVSVIDTAAMRETSRVQVGDAWLGMALSPDGKFVYLGGGGSYRVREFSCTEGVTTSGRNEATWLELKPSREFEINPGAQPGARDFIGDVTLSPDGRLLYAADLFHDTVDVINPQSGRVVDRFKTGRRPYRILFHPDGKSFFVSSWADSTVYQYDATNGSEINRVRVGPHATDMILSSRKPDRDADSGEADNGAKYRLFVTAGNTNSVFVVGVSDSKDLKLLETLNVSLTPLEPAGMTPSGLALNSDQTSLIVVCSDANAIAVADISEPRSHLMGFVPVGWYPTAARILPDGRLLVLNGRGAGSYPSTYPGPVKRPAAARAGDRPPGFIASTQTGSLSVIPALTDEGLEEATRTVISLSPYRDALLDAAAQPDSVLVSKPGTPSPIRNVIYVIKENRTYDQVFGSLGKGNGDPSLTLFDESAAPNHYKLARDFVLFDNFYVNADVSADGHSWATAAIAPDFTQRLWPAVYAGRTRYYSFEGDEPANTPPAGYLWTNAQSAGLSVRNYGEFVLNRKSPTPDARQIERVTDPSLQAITNMNYRGFDSDYRDTDRIKVFLADLKESEGSGNMPRLSIVRLGNDSTQGTTAGKPSPRAMFADNDYALGLLVEGVSKSRFWAQTAIFVLEDDAQNGPDHVDSHRSIMLAISPYTRRAIIDSTMYNQASVIRTIELILGMRPMTHFDAGARPLIAAFASTPNPAPYAAESPRISLQERNLAQSATALNAILWRTIKGTEPPAPVRSFFAR